MGKLLTEKQVLEKFRETHGNLYDYSKFSYSNAHEKAEIICKKHGSFFQRPYSHIQGAGCPACVHENKKKPIVCKPKIVVDKTAEFVQKAKLVNPGKYDYSKTVYTAAKIPVTIICPKHGEFLQKPHVHLIGSGCPSCGIERIKVGFAEFVRRAKRANAGLYEYDKASFTALQNDVVAICRKHGRFVVNAQRHSAGVGNCPKCKTETVFENFLRSARAVHGNKYKYLRKGFDWNSPTKIFCKKHGVFEQLASNHLKGSGCSRCAIKRDSKIERSVVDWLKTLGVNVETHQKLEGRKTIDIFLPEFNLGLEINGLYWHSDAHRDSSYHQDKTLEAAKHGIKLLHLWENDLRSKAAIVKSMLRINLGLAKLRIFARDTTVRQIDPFTAKRFFEKNHLQGNTAASVYLGCFLDEKLVFAMSFGKPRFNKEFEWELIRAASALNTVVVGAASKVLAVFGEKFNPASIISYANLDYSDGNLYKTLGFKFLRFSQPNYFWVRGAQVVPRYKAQKHKLENLLGKKYDANLSETENMVLAGFNRVFTAGNAVYGLSFQEAALLAQ